MLVSELLSAKVSGTILTVAPGTSVGDAASILSEHRIGALIVSETGEDVAGILSERDIVRELGKRGQVCLKDKVSDMMTRKIVTASPGDSAQSVLETMTEGRFRHMPVVEEGAMIGVISIGDVVSARLREIHQENKAMESMIMGH